MSDSTASMCALHFAIAMHTCVLRLGERIDRFVLVSTYRTSVVDTGSSVYAKRVRFVRRQAQKYFFRRTSASRLIGISIVRTYARNFNEDQRQEKQRSVDIYTANIVDPFAGSSIDDVVRIALVQDRIDVTFDGLFCKSQSDHTRLVNALLLPYSYSISSNGNTKLKALQNTHRAVLFHKRSPISLCQCR